MVVVAPPTNSKRRKPHERRIRFPAAEEGDGHGESHGAEDEPGTQARADGQEHEVVDLAPEAVTRLFDAFLERSAPDTPDRAALLDNPLVPFGGVDR